MCKGNEYVKLQNSIKMQHYEWKLSHPATYHHYLPTYLHQPKIFYMTPAHIFNQNMPPEYVGIGNPF